MNKKPALIAALVGVGVVIIMVVGLITPKAGQVRSRQKDVQTAAQQEGTLRTQLEQLQAAAKDAPADRKRLRVLEAQIPPTADLPGLIRLLNNTADKAGIDFMTIAPSQPTAAGSISVIPVQITVAGGFFAVDQYLYLLETVPRVSKVSSISVTAGPNGLPQLQIALTANFFTTDPNAGPGSIPVAAPSPTPIPSANPTPSPSPGG